MGSRISPHRLSAAWIIGIVTLFGFVGGAVADDQEAVIQKMIALNRRALAAYDSKDFDGAKASLLDAVVIGKEAGLSNDKMMARTYLHLGAVYVEGLKDRQKGLRYLALALKIRSDIKLTPSLVTPSLTQAFEDARREAEGGAPSTAAREPAPEPRAAPERPSPPPPRAAPPPPPPKAEPQPEPEPQPAPSAKGEEDDGADEPDLPANIAQPLSCPNPDEAPPNEKMVLRCVLKPGLTAARVVLFYRLPGGENFTPVPASRSKRGWYIGTIPASASVGRSVQYYFEARDGRDKEVASAGRNDSPNVILIREGAPAVGTGALATVRFQGDAHRGSDEENPLLAQTSARERARHDVGLHRRRERQFYFGVTLGSGFGFHGKSRLEYRTDLEVEAGPSSGGPIDLTPELGYQFTDQV